MNHLFEFFSEAPVLATILALAYIVVLGVFIYLFVRMYKNW